MVTSGVDDRPIFMTKPEMQMSDTSPILSLPLIQPAQAQKHVTQNEALRVLDVVVQLVVIAADQTAPPAVSTAGDRY